MKDIENLISEYAKLYNEPVEAVRDTYKMLGENGESILRNGIDELKKKT